MKLLFESPQTYANLLLGLMPANCMPDRCVNPCPPKPCGKNNYLPQFRPKTPLVFLRKTNNFAQTGNLLSDTHELPLVSKICKMILLIV